MFLNQREISGDGSHDHFCQEIRTTRNTTLSILSCHINSLSLKYCLGIMITRTDPADYLRDNLRSHFTSFFLPFWITIPL